MKCTQCQRNGQNCNVNVELIAELVLVKGRNFLQSTAKPKAAVCTNCGYVAFYIDDYEKFSE